MQLRGLPATGSVEFSAPEKTSVAWDERRTALLLCDMWDKHWCAGATCRVDELAPIMDRVVRTARDRGIFIIHAPSDTMEFYEDTPQRRRAREAPDTGIPTDAAPYRAPDEPPLPIDDSDGGCDSGEPPWHKAWSHQHPAIEIASSDAISESGREVYNLLAQEGRDRIMLMGVHTNMCILGRSFGLRALRGLGISVVLVRDMTDTMYNPARAPYVDHFEGTRRVIAHIETYICPTVESTDITSEPPFRFIGDSLSQGNGR
jgi:nicotinamidase-related amidase